MKKSVCNAQIIIRISDPWDLGESRNWQPLKGTILDVEVENSSKALLIRLIEPFEYKNMSCEYFIATPRHEGSSYEDLIQGSSVFSGLTRIPVENVDSGNPFDLSWWRGGVALIGDIEIEQA